MRTNRIDHVLFGGVLGQLHTYSNTINKSVGSFPLSMVYATIASPPAIIPASLKISAAMLLPAPLLGVEDAALLVLDIAAEALAMAEEAAELTAAEALEAAPEALVAAADAPELAAEPSLDEVAVAAPDAAAELLPLLTSPKTPPETLPGCSLEPTDDAADL